MTDLQTVEITKPTLPSPLPTDYQLLVNCAYDHWQALSAQVRAHNEAIHPRCNEVIHVIGVEGLLRSPRQDEIAAVMPAKVNAAVMLANYNYQVGNGGHAQHHDNRYSGALPSLIQLMTGATALGIPQAAESLAIMEEYGRRLDRIEKDSRPMGYFHDDEEDGMGDDCDPFDDLDTRYYALDGEKLGQDVLDRFEECVLQNFGADAFRMAA